MKKKTTKTKKDVWFVKKRGSYLPISWQAWFCYLLAVLYLAISCAYIVIMTDEAAWIIFHGLKDLLIAGVILTWIAQQKS